MEDYLYEPMTDYARDMLLMSISRDTRRMIRAVEGVASDDGLIRDVAALKERGRTNPGVSRTEKATWSAVALAAIAIIPQIIDAWIK